jgi:hypothetical protein
MHADVVLDPNTLALALVGALAVGLALVARRSRFGGRLPGSFGQGFVGFQRDGWPSGVQEDDDARWSWSGPVSPAPSRPGAAPDQRRPVPPSRPQR